MTVLLWENFSPPSWTTWTKALELAGPRTAASTDKQERDKADAWLRWLTLQHIQHVSAKGKALLASKLSTSPAENEKHTLPPEALCITTDWSRHLDSVRIGDRGQEGRPQAGLESKDR